MNTQRGASLLEVILAIALSLLLIPFMYNQIADMNNAVKDVAIANNIVKSRDAVINYIRLNQSNFNNENGTPLSEEELEQFSPLAHSGWVFKTNTQGAEFTEIFLAFSIGPDYQTAEVARYIGNDAAIVSTDNVAYSQNWAIGISDDFNFYPGDLILRITHDFGGDDKNKFLHRGAIGKENLNRMERNLYLNGNKIYNINVINPKTKSNDFQDFHPIINMIRGQTTFLKVGSDDEKINFLADKIQFFKGAKIKSNDMCFGQILVDDDAAGFDNVIVPALKAQNSDQTVRFNEALIPKSTTKQDDSKDSSSKKNTADGRDDQSDDDDSEADEDDSVWNITVDRDAVLTGNGNVGFANVKVSDETYTEYFTAAEIISPKIIISNDGGNQNQDTDDDAGSDADTSISHFKMASVWDYPKESMPTMNKVIIDGFVMGQLCHGCNEKNVFNFIDKNQYNFATLGSFKIGGSGTNESNNTNQTGETNASGRQ